MRVSEARRIAPAIAAALLAGGALYGLLAAVRPASADQEDPWLKAWKAAGLHVQFRGTSAEPSRHLQWARDRERYARPEFAGTKIRMYAIHGFRAQVVELPSDRLRGIEFYSLNDEGPFSCQGTDGDNEFSQRGRHLLILANRQRVAFWTTKLPGEILRTTERIFEETARRLPR